MQWDDWAECGLTSAVGAEASQQLKADVSLHAHRACVDLKDVCATLKQTHKQSRRGIKHDTDCEFSLKFQRGSQTLTSRSGRLNSIFRSRRPGLMRAGSRVSGLLVAISTLMLPRGSKPSSWLMSSSIVLWTSLSPPAPSSKRAPGSGQR